MTENPTSGPNHRDESPAEETNIMREKTFTPELRDLVSRISQNEDTAEVTTSTNEGPGPLSDVQGPNELLRDLHQLFYAVKFSDEGTGQLPPRRKLRELLEDEEASDPELLHDRLSSLVPGYEGYLVLALDESARAWLPVVKNHFNDEMNRLSIGLNDPLFSSLLKNEEVLCPADDSDCASNSVMAGYFTAAPGKAVTFISFDLLLGDGAEQSGEGSKGPSSSLVLVISSEGDFAREKKILPLIRNECLYELLLMVSRLKLPEKSAAGTSASLEEVIKELEFLRSRSSAGQAGTILLIRGTPGKDSYAAFSFLMVKLRRITGEESVIVRLWSEMILCMVSPAELPVIEILIKDFNNVFEDAFTLKRVDDNNTPGIAFLLEDILT